MSWDIYVQDLPQDIQRIDDIPEDFEPKNIGKRSDIIARIKEAAPNADFKDTSWGEIEGPGFSIEIGMGDDEDLECFAFHVRGGEEAAGVVADILGHLGLRALDTESETGLFDSDKAAESMAKWRQYRDQIINKSPGLLSFTESQSTGIFGDEYSLR